MKSFSNLLTILAAASCFLSGRATETDVCPGPIDVTYEAGTNLQLASLQITNKAGDVVFRKSLSQDGNGVDLSSTETLTVWAYGPKFTDCITGHVDLIIDAVEIVPEVKDPDSRRLRTRKRMLSETPSNKIVFGAIEFDGANIIFADPEAYVPETCTANRGEVSGGQLTDVAAANPGQPRVVKTNVVKWSGAGVSGHWECHLNDGTAATNLAEHLQDYVIHLKKYNCLNSGREVTDATSGPEEAFIQTCVDNGGVVTGGTISKYGYFVKKGTNKDCGKAVFATGSGVGGKVYCNLGDTATDAQVDELYGALNKGRNGP